MLCLMDPLKSSTSSLDTLPIYEDRLMAGLWLLLIGFNSAVVLAFAGLAPRKGSFGFRTGDRFDYLIQSRDWSALPWLLAASLALSAGAYCFLAPLLRLLAPKE